MISYPATTTEQIPNIVSTCSQTMINSILSSKPIVAIDLDDTLIYSYDLRPNREHICVKVGRCRVYIVFRPGVIEFLQKINEFYELFIFTASDKVYGNKVIDAIAPYIDTQHRLFRDSCISAHGYQIKDLRKLERPLNRVLLVDDMCASAYYQQSNLVRIAPWSGDPNDTVLLHQLLPALTRISQEFDLPTTAMQLLSTKVFPSLFTF